jgi:hypothetical protein
MNSFKRALKLSFPGADYILASIGISIAGGAPVPFSERK